MTIDLSTRPSNFVSMKKYISDIAFTPAVKEQQEIQGSRNIYAKMAEKRDWQQEITPELEAFLANLDSFYIATSNLEGQPYIQHRGGPAGFLKVVDKHTLGFADYAGNRQYISVGNLTENNKVHLFLMDYPNRTRIKVWGEARTVAQDEELIKKLSDVGYNARIERVFLIKVNAWDVNCPQHITPRFTEEQVRSQIDQFRQRITELEQKLQDCIPKGL